MRPVLVCSFGRAGSSLMMKMLHHGGIEPHAEDRCAYEPEDLNMDRDMRKMLPLLAGQCAKILDPQLSKWPAHVDADVIWLDRDFKEQAKSQIKFLRWQGLTIPNNAWRSVAASLRADRTRCIDLFHIHGMRLHVVTFLSILTDPARTSQELAAFLGRDLNVDAMARCVISRPSRCALDMSIEEMALASTRR